MYDEYGAIAEAKAAVDREASPLRDASMEIAELLSQLEGLLTRFDNRLQPVLRNVPTNAISEGDVAALKAIREDSPHVSDLRKHAERIRLLISHGESLLHRIDA